MRTDNIKLCDVRFYKSNPGHNVGSPSPLSVMTFVLSSSVFHSTLILSFVENVVEYVTISFFLFLFFSHLSGNTGCCGSCCTQGVVPTV